MDLLLKEMNSNTAMMADLDLPSPINSPTKPLNFPNQAIKLEPRDKDFSSSSDTYISESESRQSPVKKENPNTSLDRNFDFNSSDQVHQTIESNKNEISPIDEFSFVDNKTPMTSTTDLSHPTGSHRPETRSLDALESPNRSIMKKSASNSPRKSVAFTNSNPEIHRYPAPNTQTLRSHSPPEPEQLNHQWNNEINKSSSEEEEDVAPPSPPPHTSFNSLLNNDAADDVDSSTLSELKNRHYNEMPLKEKMDIYLSQKLTGDDLDQHLENMQKAVALQNQSNIHHLSLDLQKHNAQEIENPLESLADTSDVQLRSSGSSHSSLQSLRDDNRVLQSYAGWSSSKGVQLNEGIKGLSDTMVESLIPQNQDSSSDHLEFTSKGSKKEIVSSDENSYDTTEKSIMNLLNGSRSDLVGAETKQTTAPLETEETNEIHFEAKLEEKPEETPTERPEGDSSTSQRFVFTLKDDSDIVDQTGQFSIRDHVDGDWKFEDSHDGDKEDNSDYTKNDVTEIGQDQQNPPFSTSNSRETTPQFEDASEDFTVRSLAPPRSPTKSLNESIHSESESQKIEDKEDKDKEENVLANSSNIAPPEELTLPQVEIGNYSSFEDITKNVEKSGSAFEDSLSAENDVEKAPTDFLTIWRTHEKKKTHQKRLSSSHILKDLDVPHSSALVAEEQRRIPKSLLPNKFREVNVLSRRVLDPEVDDLQVSGFLPELSDDSGFETHFKSMLREANSTMNTTSRKISAHKPLSTTNVLSNIDDDTSFSTQDSGSVRHSLRPEPAKVPPSLAKGKITVKPSKFRVPSFEIKRSTSILSPRNMYNDIYEDTVKAPTIRGHGMKTLPSMDRGDVKRILETKRVISQDEYSRIRLGNKNSSRAVVAGDDDDYDAMQQHASIVNTSVDTELVVDKDVLPHLANELLRAPKAMLSSDQVFRDYDFYSSASNIFNNSQPSTRVPSASASKPEQPQPEIVLDRLPDPHPDLVVTPKKNSRPVTRTVDNDKESELDLKPTYSPEKFNYKVVDKPETKKGERLSPIKIRSPAKGRAPLEEKDNIANASKPLEYDHQPKPSTVSVPTLDSTTTDATLLSTNRERHEYTQQAQSPPTHERGRLFLRVVGIKNLALPDISKHQAEFSVTLDNGVHCIKTPNYKLDGSNAIIGKEFELTVCDSLEFILTMKASYEKPNGTLKEVRERRIVKSKNRISRMFGSKDIITTTKFVAQEAKDSWSRKIAQDGSFARCYVDLDQYEDKITGKVCSFNLTCFNEWETIAVNNTQLTKTQPYKIGQLEVKMLFVPKVEEWECLPTSIKSAYDTASLILREAEFTHEGYMHQEGGDCETWKKRFFKLNGSSLIAHSEYSLKPRAKINLSKIADVIYLDKENARSTGNYRNFSDGLLFEHAFKVKFANGETIEFGTDNGREKAAWISILQKLVHRNKLRHQPWVKLMMQDAAIRQERRSRPASMIVE